MNWEALGAISESLGAVGVVVTLIYLAIQVKHSKSSVDANTASLEEGRRLALAQAYESRTSMILDYLSAIRDSEHMSEAVQINDRTDEELRHQLMLRWWCNYLDNLHFQHENGFLNQDYRDTQYITAIKKFAPDWRAIGIKEPRTAFQKDVDQILSLNEAD